METSSLVHFVDTWTIRAVVASRFLAGLYRGLGDGKQASNAIQAGAPAEERARRLGLAPRVTEGLTLFGEGEVQEIEKENEAWLSLVESHAGISAFHAMAEGCSSRQRGLHGARQAAAKALDRALQGYRVAFPDHMAHEGISRAISVATSACTAAFLAAISEDPGLEIHTGQVQDLHQTILEALRIPAGLVS